MGDPFTKASQDARLVSTVRTDTCLAVQSIVDVGCGVKVRIREGDLIAVRVVPVHGD